MGFRGLSTDPGHVFFGLKGLFLEPSPEGWDIVRVREFDPERLVQTLVTTSC